LLFLLPLAVSYSDTSPLLSVQFLQTVIFLPVLTPPFCFFKFFASIAFLAYLCGATVVLHPFSRSGYLTVPPLPCSPSTNLFSSPSLAPCGIFWLLGTLSGSFLTDQGDSYTHWSRAFSFTRAPPTFPYPGLPIIEEPRNPP